MNNISEITRQDILDIIKDGFIVHLDTSVQMKHFQCVVHKPECSIQTQVVILKVLMINSSAVAEPR